MRSLVQPAGLLGSTKWQDCHFGRRAWRDARRARTMEGPSLSLPLRQMTNPPFGIRRTGRGEPGRAKRDLVRHKIVRNNFEHLAKRRWPLRGGGQDARSKFVGNKFERICAKRSEPKGQGAWMHPVIPTDSLLDLMSLRDMFNCEYSDSQRPSPPEIENPTSCGILNPDVPPDDTQLHSVSQLRPGSAASQSDRR